MSDYSTYNSINSHLKRHFYGEDVFVFDEIESPDFHLDTYLIRPGDSREYYTLLTGGVSGNPMRVPEPRIPSLIELMLLLPKNWPFESEKLRSADYFWPIEYIKSLGRFPHSNNTFISYGHTIPEPEDSYLYSKGFVATLLLKSSLIDRESQRIWHEDDNIEILMPIPLYRNEYEFKKENDLFLVKKKMQLNGFPDIINLERKSFI